MDDRVEGLLLLIVLVELRFWVGELVVLEIVLFWLDGVVVGGVFFIMF